MRERDRDRERRDRDRYRDDRYYDEHDRDSKRARRDDDAPRRRYREDSRDRGDARGEGKAASEVCTLSSTDRRTMLNCQTPRQSTAEAEEEAKKARQARVEAWKQKQLLKKGAEGGASPAGVTPSAASPAIASPSTPTHNTNGTEASVPGKKFDHKEIAKRAAAALERGYQKTALGGDISIPKSTTHAPTVDASKLANNAKAAISNTTNGEQCPDLDLCCITALTHCLGVSNLSTNGKIGGFGLSTVTADTKDKSAVAKTAAGLGEEEEVQRRLEKLPEMPMQLDTGDTALANNSDDQDMVDDMRSDEEEAEAVREAAQKRAEEVQAQANGEVAMVNAQPAGDEEEEDQDEDMGDEVDPLDAYMDGLETTSTKKVPQSGLVKSQKNEPQVFDSDDEGVNLDAVGNDIEQAIAAAAAKRKKKDVPQVDHAKMNYEPFRKNFYSESAELADMTQEDVDILRSDLDNIKCRGVDVPKPILNWSQAGFGSQILEVIREQKFEKPTSIQSQALPAIMSGRDVIGIAKTGSGKTAAFILPMFRHIKDQRPLRNMEGPIGIIVAPTRELATQIYRDCKPYLNALNLRAVCCYGGAPIKDQIADLKRGAEIVVCTPGRMIDLLAANGGRVLNLARVTYVVLDEADRMFDMGFEPQISKILSRVRPDRQTVLFSATFPKSMEALARKALTKPIEIIVGGRSVVAPEITQIIEVRSEGTKFRRTLHLLGDVLSKDDDARCLIFVEKQETADSLLKDLWKASYPTVSIHGGREQIDRDQAINDFKAGITSVMIATSVAARGLDVKQLKLVINFDSPNHIEDYVHRSGRTGRAGNTGTAVTFVTSEQDRFAPFLVRALTDSKQEIPQDLADLAKRHEEKVKSGEAKKISTGFGGRGVERLDAARDAEKAVQKKQYKTEDGEGEQEEDESKDKKKAEVDKMVAKAGGAIKERDAQPWSATLPSHLANALDSAMHVKKADPPAEKSGGKQGGSAKYDPMAKVNAARAQIESKVLSKGRSTIPPPTTHHKQPGLTRRTTGGGAQPTVPIDNKGPDAGAFHAILEINDFPQSARWKVTNRTNVAKILEASGTSITNKGNYYGDGRVPGPGELPKLYILVEGDTENAVENAMSELTRLLKEGTVEALTKEANAPRSGRYNVT